MKSLIIFVLLFSFVFGCSTQSQSSSTQNNQPSPLPIQSPSNFAERVNLANEFNGKFSGKLENVTFYVTASQNEIMFVGGSGLTEEIANDIQREKDVFPRLQSLGFKEIVFRTIKKDIKVDVPSL